ncbi:MAG: adenosine deaminase [Saprospiraceae bacterium]
MKPIFSSFLLFCFSTLAVAQTPISPEQTTTLYLDSIRQNRAALTAFFQQMPKGGDLHHHFSGSVYTETFVNEAIQRDYWLHRQTLEVKDSPKAPANDPNWVRFSTLQKNNQLLYYRQRLLRLWSVKDFIQEESASDEHFFATFDSFSVASTHILQTGLLELKKRAQAEHVQYIETMRGSPSCSVNISLLNAYNSLLRKLQSDRNEAATQDTLQSLFRQLLTPEVRQCVLDYTQELEALHRSLQLDDTTFTLRYQMHTIRVVPPVLVFSRLLTGFLAAESSPLIVGVNIVAPEDNPIAMQDYWLHMQFFKFCHQQFPQVQYAMHAGELTLGLVPSEELTWHINAAVKIAGAHRIGHGVDLPYEADVYTLLDLMRTNNIAVEINLTSNEFILRVKDDRHPILLYQEAGVPLVISTDDAGVLRSSLTEQFVLLAHRYPSISYAHIKQFVYNSITHSFIEENTVKTALKNTLDRRFAAFEQLIATKMLKKNTLIGN